MDTKKVWFITGASKGLGLILTKQLLSNGQQVAATSRSLESLEKEMPQTENFLPLEVNIVDEKSTKKAIDKAVEKFGKIDVVVNNAGYAQLGTLEELSDEESRKNFDVNVFGALNIIRSVMPQLRQQKNGHIINISSIAGFNGMYAGVGIYCATKFALAGLSEALAAEVKEFGIDTTIVYPGTLRTNFLESSSVGVPKTPIAEYTEGRHIVNLHLDVLNGTQQGDPEKVAHALIELSDMENPPLHLFLGSDSVQLAQNKIKVVEQDLQQYEKLSLSTDF
ncbi:SDR family NAD(P)-dependent oxidoreductase [Weeksellaceae bacterium A-14]